MILPGFQMTYSSAVILNGVVEPTSSSSCDLNYTIFDISGPLLLLRILCAICIPTGNSNDSELATGTMNSESLSLAQFGASSIHQPLKRTSPPFKFDRNCRCYQGCPKYYFNLETHNWLYLHFGRRTCHKKTQKLITPI